MIMSDTLPVATNQTNFPESMPVLPLKGAVAFPLTLIPLSIGLERSVRLVEDAMHGNRLIFLTSEKPYLTAQIESLPDQMTVGVELEGLRRAILDALRRMVILSTHLGDELVDIVEEIADIKQLVYVISSTLSLGMKVQQEILEIDTIEGKLTRLLAWLQHEISIRELGKKITLDTRERLTKAQKDYFLREQVRSIQKELGEDEDSMETGELKKRLEAAGLSEEAHREAWRELERLSNIPTASPEHGEAVG